MVEFTKGYGFISDNQKISKHLIHCNACLPANVTSDPQITKTIIKVIQVKEGGRKNFET